jgi:hypothetical protein
MVGCGGFIERLYKHLGEPVDTKLFLPSPNAVIPCHYEMYLFDLRVWKWLHGHDLPPNATSEDRKRFRRGFRERTGNRDWCIRFFQDLDARPLNDALEEEDRIMKKRKLDEIEALYVPPTHPQYLERVMGPNGYVSTMLSWWERTAPIKDVDIYRVLNGANAGLEERDLHDLREAISRGDFIDSRAIRNAIAHRLDPGLGLGETYVGQRVIENLIRERELSTSEYEKNGKKKWCNDRFALAATMAPITSRIVFFDTPRLYTTTKLLAAGITLDRMVCVEMDAYSANKMRDWPHVVNMTFREYLYSHHETGTVGALWLDYFCTWEGNQVVSPRRDMDLLMEKLVLSPAPQTAVFLTVSKRGHSIEDRENITKMMNSHFVGWSARTLYEYGTMMVKRWYRK